MKAPIDSCYPGTELRQIIADQISVPVPKRRVKRTRNRWSSAAESDLWEPRPNMTQRLAQRLVFSLRLVACVMLASALIFKAPWVDSLRARNVKLLSLLDPERRLSKGDIAAIAWAAGTEFGVPPGLVLAVIQVESNFNQTARSHRGAMGLMQITGLTARHLAVSDPYCPFQNVSGGTRYLRELLDRFNGNEQLALAAFNAGPTVVRKFRGIPPYPETRNYVRKVLAVYGQNQSVIPKPSRVML